MNRIIRLIVAALGQRAAIRRAELSARAYRVSAGDRAQERKAS
jgi:hypothetical protein